MIFKRKKRGVRPGAQVVPQLRVYGHDKTIHQNESLDVEVDKDGKVVAVWFRCQPLPFRQSDVEDTRAREMERMYGSGSSEGLVAVTMRAQS